MRAPFYPETSDLCPEERDITGSDSENENEICNIERSIDRSHTYKSSIFGKSIEDLLKKSSELAPQIPFVISRICSYIELHGMHEKCLFVDGEEKMLIEKLIKEFAASGDASLESTGHVASVAKLLVIILEELPEPLIPISIQSDFIKDIEKLPHDVSDCLLSLKGSLKKLPDCAYQILKYLSHFLLQVAFYEEYNGLNSNNLAVIFGPLIFRSTTKDKQMILTFQDITNCFVKDYHKIFENNMIKDSLQVIMTLDSSKASSKLSKNKPYPSSVMPLRSLSPLSVVIPVIGDVSIDNEKTSVPILLTKGQLNAIPQSITTTSNFDKGALKEIVITRKRKERRFSGEDSQQRSSSEERPSPSSLLVVGAVDILRRCCSHEEVTEDQNKDTCGLQPKLMSKDDFQLIGSSVMGSPHPPTAKRREIELNNVGDDYSWETNSASDAIHPIFSNQTKQNSVAESKQTTMECDALDSEDDSTESGQLSIVSNMPKSASFPVLKSETCSSESDKSNLSLSWSMLFEDSEPVRAEPHLNLTKAEESLLSPSVQSLRNSNYYEAPLSPSAYRNYLSYRSTHLDPSVPPSPPVEQEDFAKKFEVNSSAAESIRQLTKKIHSIKRRIRKYEEKFETEFGFKPSHAEKSNNSEAKKMQNDLYKARKELKTLKEEAHLEHVGSLWHADKYSHILEDTTNQFVTKDKNSVEDYFGFAVKTLSDDRKTANRPESFDEMTSDQVVDEKLAIQKALLSLEEKIKGKPVTKVQKDTCRPLYDRYRFVKRLLVRSGYFPSSTAKNKELCSELQPILEHETMDFPSCFQKDTEKKEEPKELSSVSENVKSVNQEKSVVKEENRSPYYVATKYDNSSLHELPLSELILQMQTIKSEKRRLRKIVKDFETEFLRLNGRKAQKEDRAPIESIYNEYKHVKARLKLLDALVSKHDQHQVM